MHCRRVKVIPPRGGMLLAHAACPRPAKAAWPALTEAHGMTEAGKEVGLRPVGATARQPSVSLRLLQQGAGSLLFGVSPHDPLTFVAHNAARRLSAGHAE